MPGRNFRYCHQLSTLFFTNPFFMKKQLLIVCSLLFFSATSFAQLAKGNITYDGKQDRFITIKAGFILPEGNSITAGKDGTDNATLLLKHNELIMETTTYDLSRDNPAVVRQAWRIPLTFSDAVLVKELEFQPDGNMIVRDTKNNVLWGTGVNHDAQVFKMYPDGKLQLVSHFGKVHWEKEK